MPQRPVSVAILLINHAPEPTGDRPYTTGLAKGLAQREHDVQVLTGYPHYPQWKRDDASSGFRSEEEIDGVRICRFSHRAPRHLWIGRSAMEVASRAAAADQPMGVARGGWQRRRSFAPRAAERRLRMHLGIAARLYCARDFERRRCRGSPQVAEQHYRPQAMPSFAVGVPDVTAPATRQHGLHEPRVLIPSRARSCAHCQEPNGESRLKPVRSRFDRFARTGGIVFSDWVIELAGAAHTM